MSPPPEGPAEAGKDLFAEDVRQHLQAHLGQLLTQLGSPPDTPAAEKLLEGLIRFCSALHAANENINLTGIKDAEQDPQVKVFHAGTGSNADNPLITAGGRVLGVTALGNNLEEATKRAYEAAEKIHFDGCYFRRDIAAKAL